MTDDDLVTRLRQNDTRALARALTLVENRSPEARRVVRALFPEAGRASIWGITGPPGVGKSTLADALASRASGEGHRVGVLAIDPSSPFTGGALLGDRTRMESSARSSAVFIRSMATRGHVGGLATAAFEALTLLDASGRDLVLLETVGVGQDEVEVAGAVGLTIVVLAPGMGDELQASKAGLLEIADILVVNKADRDGAERLAADLGPWSTPVVRAIATEGEGIDGLLAEARAIESSSSYDRASRRRRFIESWLREALHQTVRDKLTVSIWEEALDSIVSGTSDPFAGAEQILRSIGK